MGEKRLFKTGGFRPYNSAGKGLSDAIREATRSILKQYAKDGYCIRDIENVATNEIRISCSFVLLLGDKADKLEEGGLG